MRDFLRGSLGPPFDPIVSWSQSTYMVYGITMVTARMASEKGRDLSRYRLQFSRHGGLFGSVERPSPAVALWPARRVGRAWRIRREARELPGLIVEREGELE